MTVDCEENQSFRLPGVTRFLLYGVWAWTILWLGPWAVALLKAAWQARTFSDGMIISAFPALLVYVWFEMWRGLETCVIVTDDAITLHKPWQSRTIAWSDIDEVGAYRPRYAYRVSWWTVYLKARSSGEKKWGLDPFHFRDGRELVALLFEKAPHARFVKFVNESWVPFFSRATALPWDRHEGLNDF